MSNLQKGLQREIELFRDAILSDGGSIPEVSKAAFCKARKKLRYTAFEELSQVAVSTYYATGTPATWKGFRPVGVDGSNVELPGSQEIQQQFGVFKTRLDGKAICMARSLLVYDALNQLTLHGSLGTMEESENSMLWDCLDNLELYQNDILLFDRNFASKLLIFYLTQMGVQFCFRMKKDVWKKVAPFYHSNKDNEIITLEIPAYDKEKAIELGITLKKVKCRLVRVELDNDETEILLTSLLDTQRYNKAAMKELYGYRWPIEELYKSFKHKVCIENFSGKSVEAVMQDFHVKIFIMNLTAIAIQPINEALKKKTAKVKYKHQVNIIEAIASMKKAVVSFFLTRKMGEIIRKVLRRMAKITEPIRPGRKFRRHPQPKRKHYMNYKPT